MFGIEYKNWTITDTCTIIKFAGFVNIADWGIEIIRDYIDAVTQDEELVQGLYSYNDQRFDDLTVPIITKQELIDLGFQSSEKFEEIDGFLKGDIANYAKMVLTEIYEDIGNSQVDGSNAFAISGEHTESGKPIFSNDPHLGTSIPALWNFYHLEYPNGTFISGATFPGIPYFAYFVTESIALGPTVVPADGIDIYKEKIIGDQYEYEGQLYSLEIRQEIIKVKKQEDIVFNVKSTRHGPLLTQNIKALNDVAKWAPILLPKGNYSLKWNQLIPEKPRTLEFMRRFNKAKSAKELHEMFKEREKYSANFLYVDNQGEHGNIGFSIIGEYPIRSKNSGHRISRGWINENEWDDYIKGEDKPYLFNPEKGYIVNANNPISDMNSKTQIATFTLGTARSYRITELIEELIRTKSGKIGYEDVINILKDVKDVYAEKKKEYFLKTVRSFMKENKINNSRITDVANRIEQWDAVFDSDRSEPAFFTFWEYFFRSNFMADKSRDDHLIRLKMFSHPYFEHNFVQLSRNISENPNHFSAHCKLFDDKEIKSCAESLYWALNYTVEYIEKYHNLETITWRDVHKMRFPNIPFTKSFLKPIFDREVAMSGNSNTVSLSGIKFDKFENKSSEGFYSSWLSPKQEFAGYHGPRSRLISPMNNTVFHSLDTGVSESIFSGHYFDMNKDHMEYRLHKTIFPRSKDPLQADQDVDFRFILTTKTEADQRHDL